MITLSSFKLTSLLNSIENKIEGKYIEGVELFTKDSIDAFVFEKGISFANDQQKIYKSCSQKYTWFFKAENEKEIEEQLNNILYRKAEEEAEVKDVVEVEVKPKKKTKNLIKKAKEIKQKSAKTRSKKKRLGYSRTQLREASHDDYKKMVEENIKLANLTGVKAERYRACAKQARERKTITENKTLWETVNEKLKVG